MKQNKALRENEVMYENDRFLTLSTKSIKDKNKISITKNERQKQDNIQLTKSTTPNYKIKPSIKPININL